MPRCVLPQAFRPLCAIALPAVVIGLISAASSIARAGENCEVLYVAKGHVNPVNDGSSWANAFCTATALADGIAAAAARMDGPSPPACVDIYVAAGVYKPSDSGASFAMHDKVHLYGGFKVGDDFSVRRTGCLGGENAGRPCETAEDCPGGACDLERVTIISGDINDDDGAECYVDADCGGTNQCVAGHCLIWPNFGPMVTYNQAGTCTLDGFVLKLGYSSLGSAVRITGEDGICPPVGPTLRYCLVRRNYAGAVSLGGGAVSNEYAGAIIDRCLFSGNEAYYAGGALYSGANHLRVVDSSFVNNSATGPHGSGGGVVAFKPLDTPDCPATAINTFEGCDFAGNVATSNYGTGGLRGSEMVLSRCTFRGNYGGGVGAVVLGGAGQATIEGCEFVDNTSATVGAIESYSGLVVRDSTFDHNTGTFAGAMALPSGNAVVEACRFFNNVGDFAGAVYLSNICTVRDTIFAGNRWSGGNYSVAGAAIFLDADEDGDELTCERCRFFGNSGAEGTVTVLAAKATIVDSLFAGNGSPAVSLRVEEADVDLVQCTLAKNSASMGFGSINTTFVRAAQCEVDISNSIIWGNRDEDSSLECTDQIDCGQECTCATCADSPCFECSPLVTLDVSHSDIEHPSCVWPGAGNINEDPMFVREDMPRDCDGNGWGDPQCAAGPCMPGVTGCDDYGDFRLRPGSPAINAGDSPLPDLPETDLDGNPRVVGCVDMGAYEFAGGGTCCTDDECAESEICCANVCAPNLDSDLDTVPDCLDLCPGEDDRIDADENGTPDCAQFQAIPAVSTWGLLTISLVILIVVKTRSLRSRNAWHPL